MKIGNNTPNVTYRKGHISQVNCVQSVKTIFLTIRGNYPRWDEQVKVTLDMYR